MTQDPPPQSATFSTTMDMSQGSVVEIPSTYEGMFNGDAFHDAWWPTNGLDWLNSLPIDAATL